MNGRENIWQLSVMCDGVRFFHWLKTDLVCSFQEKNLYRLSHSFCFAGESAGRLSPVLEMELETRIWSRITLSVLVNLLTTKNEIKKVLCSLQGVLQKYFFSQIKNDKWAQVVLGRWVVAILTAKSLKQRKYQILTDAKEISTFRPALKTLKAKAHRCSHKTWLERSQVEYYKICKTGKSFFKNRRDRHIH